MVDPPRNPCNFIHKVLCRKSNSSLSPYDLRSRYNLSNMSETTKDTSPVPLWVSCWHLLPTYTDANPKHIWVIY